MLLQLATGAVLGAVIATGAWLLGMLDRSGALAAAILGTLVFGLGGLGWALVLLIFFISSSLLSRVARGTKAGLEEKFAKGARRDAAQVLANGGAAGVFVILGALFSGATWPWLGFAASLAAANADTWATELGVLSPDRPRLITTLKPAERGASGAVSLVGSMAALGGAALVAVGAVIFWPGRELILAGRDAAILSAQAPGWILLVALAGVAGSLADSLLGASLQVIYFCPACRKETEKHPQHTCGAPTQRVRGLGWLNNEWVNAACTLVGAGVALAVYFFI